MICMFRHHQCCHLWEVVASWFQGPLDLFCWDIGLFQTFQGRQKEFQGGKKFDKMSVFNLESFNFFSISKFYTHTYAHTHLLNQRFLLYSDFLPNVICNVPSFPEFFYLISPWDFWAFCPFNWGSISSINSVWIFLTTSSLHLVL